MPPGDGGDAEPGHSLEEEEEEGGEAGELGGIGAETLHAGNVASEGVTS